MLSEGAFSRTSTPPLSKSLGPNCCHSRIDKPCCRFQLANPRHTRGETVTVREALDSGKVWIDRELMEQPELRAEMLLHIGEAYYGREDRRPAASVHTSPE